MFLFFKTDYLQLGGLSTNDLCISCTLETIEKLSEFKISQARKRTLSSSLLMRLKGTVVHWPCPHLNAGLLEITMTGWQTFCKENKMLSGAK